MTTGYIVFVAVLVLGGVIATVGDRIGTRVGKARLSLFNLRPRNTAVLITIMTGSVISATTLAVLLALSDQLRTGLFKLDQIKRNLRHARSDIEQTRSQKSQVERELAKAKSEQKAEQIEVQKRQAAAQKRLETTNQSLQAAIAKQAQTQIQLNRNQTKQAQTQTQLNLTQRKQARTQSQLNLTQNQLGQVSTQFLQAQARLDRVSQQAKALRAEIQQRQTERQQLIDQVKEQISQRDQAVAKLDQNIAQRDLDIAERDRVIAQRESRLKDLETQQGYLEREVATLEQFYQSYQVLRLGNVVLARDQVLAAGVVRIIEPSAARQAVEQLLREANRTAIQLTQPSTEQISERVVQITESQVDQLLNQLNDGKVYVVRILSSGNYVLGEKHVQVFADAMLNRVVFQQGETVATNSANPATMTALEIQQQLDQLLRASEFRAQRAGIVGNTIQIGDGRIETLIHFAEQLKQYDKPVEIKAVAAEVTYTAGPLKVELVAVQNGQVVFRT